MTSQSHDLILSIPNTIDDGLAASGSDRTLVASSLGLPAHKSALDSSCSSQHLDSKSADRISLPLHPYPENESMVSPTVRLTNTVVVHQSKIEEMENKLISEKDLSFVTESVPTSTFEQFQGVLSSSDLGDGANVLNDNENLMDVDLIPVSLMTKHDLEHRFGPQESDDTQKMRVLSGILKQDAHSESDHMNTSQSVDEPRGQLAPLIQVESSHNLTIEKSDSYPQQPFASHETSFPKSSDTLTPRSEMKLSLDNKKCTSTSIETNSIEGLVAPQ